MTLVATVLLSAIAATIALVLVRQAVLSARAESVRSDVDAAHQLALGAKAELEAELARDPQFYLSSLFRYERPRLCTTSRADGSVSKSAVVPPERPTEVDNTDPTAPHDTPWPKACGSAWSYIGVGQYAIGSGTNGQVVTYDPVGHPVRMELSPPAPGQPNLKVRILAAKGRAETGLTLAYKPNSATALTAYSAQDLRLDAVLSNEAGAASAAAVAVRGTLYAGGQMYLPTSEADYAGAQLLAEDGFVGSIPDTGRFYTAGPVDDSTREIRSALSTPLALSGLRSAFSRMASVACPDGVPSARPGLPAYSSSLCLRHGMPVLATPAGESTERVITVSTTGSEIGQRPAAYLLMFAGTVQAPTVRVYTAATHPATAGECRIRCDLASVAAADYRAGRHPVSTPAPTRSSAPGAPLWQPLGEMRLPVTGIIATDADTYIGQCSLSVDTSAGQCAQTTPARSVTVLAGTPDDPADIFVSGPLAGTTATAGATAAQVGLVATRSVTIPYWARPQRGDLTVRANIVAFGYGLERGESGLRSLPQRLAPREDNPNNYGGDLNIVGSVAAPSLEAALPGWAHVTLSPNAVASATPPPNFPGFSAGWTQQSANRLSSFAVCAASSCASRW